ncbi:hypothetical protein [Halanaerobacter jeridensis]|uniref:Uncharacterized protein n=1 Tax=Halanaerobacter jeridensis TaxID=706427 RepID=A0A938XT32_9FIRM|nr:hypothetical protein [Halanaerobacter jeridensis]MBM7555806.1 hypothetical protein [Halanaerobacter jeridensis]
MDAGESLKTLRTKYKENGYRLSQSDSKAARQMIVELLKKEKMQKISEAIDYVIDFPSTIGVRAYMNYFQKLDDNRQQILNKMLVNNENFKENTNNKSVNRASVLIDKMIANENVGQEQIYFILKNVCQLILNNVDDAEAKKDEKRKLLSVFDSQENVTSLKFALAKEQRIKNNLKDELEDYKQQVTELKEEVNELKQENKKKDDKRMFGFW